MSIFGKKVDAVVNYVDLDEDNNIIKSSETISGKKNTPVDYDPAGDIRELEEKGYILVNNGLDPVPDFEDGIDHYDVTFKHKLVTVDADNPGYGYTKSKLTKEIKQVIQYRGAASRTPETSVNRVTFSHIYEVDSVTGDVVKDKGWKPATRTFMEVGTPTLPGFVPNKAVVGGETVKPTDEDKEYVVDFKINNAPSELTQTAVIRYVDHTNDNKIIHVDTLTGQPNMPIDYDPKQEIDKLAKQGFTLVNNGFNGNGDIQFFGNSDSYEPIFIITMDYSAQPVNEEHPNDKVDPSSYSKDSTFTVNFAGLSEDQLPDPIEQTAHWTRTVAYVPETGEVITDGYYDSQWQSDIGNFEDVKIPVIKGYHTDLKVVKALPVKEEDQVVTVTYHENAKIVPVDSEGNEIPGADHPTIETDPDDSSNAKVEEAVPEVDGYYCEFTMVSPKSPGQDLDIVYHKIKKTDVNSFENPDKSEQEEQSTENIAATAQEDLASEVQTSQETEPAVELQEEAQDTEVENTQSEQKEEPEVVQTQTAAEALNGTGNNSNLHDQVAIVNFIDIDHNGESLTSSGPLVGKPGESINDLYSTEIPLKVIKKAGYKVVFNNFDNEGFIQRFDNNDLMTQVFTIGVSKKAKEAENKGELVATNMINNFSKDLATSSKMKQLEETRNKLEKLQPTLLSKGNSDDSQTVSRLLDIITGLLNLVFIVGNVSPNNVYNDNENSSSAEKDDNQNNE